MKRILLMMVMAFGIILLTACGNEETEGATGTSGDSVEPLELRVGVVVGDWSPHYQGAQAWADALDEKTDGQIKMTVFPDGQLGGEREMLEAIQNGSLDIGLISSSVFSVFEPKMAVIDIPFLVSSFDEAETLMDSKAGEELSALMLEKGIRNLAWGHNDFRVITNNKQAIEKPEDLAAVKMRVPESKVLADWYSELGSMATPMPFPDIYAALQQGVVDGQDNGPILSYAAKFFEHQDYLTVSNHQYSPLGFFISESVWSGLSDAQKEALEETAKEASEVERQAIREFNETSIAAMEEAGVETFKPNEEERAAFKETSSIFIDQIRKEAGEDLTNLVLQEAGYEE
ncbi:TRAP transporter substrate-binding protein [Planococcus beijingensis]|uniref:TRAP transporter substrate-binding protein n=1 Tax=Planococcus beijingensis TaxID=2782551 RepID=UPI00193AED2B|nr:TRAP transporter substrate-binding protein [Planococcus beijingensis]